MPADWQTFDTEASLVSAVADLVELRCRQAITSGGQFHLVFPGGRSIVPVLQELATRSIDWHGVHLYMTDERCVPLGDQERNDRLVDDYLLSIIDADGLVFHRIPAERGPDVGAIEFASELQHLPPFDLVILGMGEDGHTASLFMDSLDEEPTDVRPVHYSPKPPPERVSLGFNRLTGAHERIVLAMGKSKQPVIGQIRSGQMFPIVRASPDSWFVTSNG
jgi:6-phosphogluconolactonase